MNDLELAVAKDLWDALEESLEDMDVAVSDVQVDMAKGTAALRFGLEPDADDEED